MIIDDTSVPYSHQLTILLTMLLEMPDLLVSREVSPSGRAGSTDPRATTPDHVARKINRDFSLTTAKFTVLPLPCSSTDIFLPRDGQRLLFTLHSTPY